jgi:hypothetical protein
MNGARYCMSFSVPLPARSRLGQLSEALAMAIATVHLSLLPALPTHAAPVSIGVMGASLSDEYAYNGRAYAENWVEQYALQNGGPVNFGALGTNPAPRNEGYAYNWAQSGATSTQLLNGGQATGLAAQIPVAGIQYVVLETGGDDFAPNGAAWDAIYNSTWSQSQINTYVNQTISNISTAINTMPAGTKMALVTVSGFGNTPSTKMAWPDASKRQLVDNAIAQVNAGIKSVAQTNHLVVADLASLTQTVFGTEANPNSTVQIGGVTINLTQKTSSNPSTAAFVSDGIHPNTTIQGVMGDLFMQALDTGYNASIPLFSEAQILAHDGLSYGGSDTLAAEVGPYSKYVINYVPEPTTLILATFCTFTLLVMRWRSWRGQVA